MSTQIIQEVIDFFGSQKNAAEILGITQPTLSHSLEVGSVSAEVALRIQKATKGRFKAIDLRPSLKRDFAFISVA